MTHSVGSGGFASGSRPPERLASALLDAHDLLGQVVDLVREAWEAAQAGIVDHAHQPLGPRVVHPEELYGEPMGLGPWLNRLARLASGTSAEQVELGLAAWRRVAEGTAAVARSVRDENRAAEDRRDELLELLEAYQVKAADRDIAESAPVRNLHEHTRRLLTTPPVDLAAADAALRAYALATNAPDGSEDPPDAASPVGKEPLP